MSLKVETYTGLGSHGMFLCAVTESRVMSDVAFEANALITAPPKYHLYQCSLTMGNSNEKSEMFRVST